MYSIHIRFLHLSFPNGIHKRSNSIVTNSFFQIFDKFYVLLICGKNFYEFIIGNCEYRVFTIFSSIYNQYIFHPSPPFVAKQIVAEEALGFGVPHQEFAHPSDARRQQMPLCQRATQTLPLLSSHITAAVRIRGQFGPPFGSPYSACPVSGSPGSPALLVQDRPPTARRHKWPLSPQSGQVARRRVSVAIFALCALRYGETTGIRPGLVDNSRPEFVLGCKSQRVRAGAASRVA
jgi:hypothetical protein